jgi:hypothetical protein
MIQYEIEDMRKQLAQATSDIQAQQKVLSSSEEFVTCSSLPLDLYGGAARARYAIQPYPVPATSGTGVF